MKVYGTIYETKIRRGQGESKVDCMLAYGPVDLSSEWCLNEKKKKMKLKTPLNKACAPNTIWNLPFEFTAQNSCAFKIQLWDDKEIYGEIKFNFFTTKTSYNGWFTMEPKSSLSPEPGGDTPSLEVKVNLRWENVNLFEPDPEVVELLASWLEDHGLTTQFILRVPGSPAEVQDLLQACILNDSKNIKLPDSESAASVHVVASVLKNYIRTATSIFPDSLQGELVNCTAGSLAECLQGIRKVLAQVPAQGRRVLAVLVALLNTISDNAEINKMDAKNLSIMMTPGLFRGSSLDMDIINKQTLALQHIIQYFSLLFLSYPVFVRVTKKDTNQNIIGREWLSKLVVFPISLKEKYIICVDPLGTTEETDISLSIDLSMVLMDDVSMSDMDGGDTTKFPFSVSRQLFAASSDMERKRLMSMMKKWIERYKKAIEKGTEQFKILELNEELEEEGESVKVINKRKSQKPYHFLKQKKNEVHPENTSPSFHPFKNDRYQSPMKKKFSSGSIKKLKNSGSKKTKLQSEEETVTINSSNSSNSTNSTTISTTLSTTIQEEKHFEITQEEWNAANEQITHLTEMVETLSKQVEMLQKTVNLLSSRAPNVRDPDPSLSLPTVPAFLPRSPSSQSLPAGTASSSLSPAPKSLSHHSSPSLPSSAQELCEFDLENTSTLISWIETFRDDETPQPPLN